MNVIIGADDSGIYLAKKIFKILSKEYKIKLVYRKGADYPDIAKEVCSGVLKINNTNGILVCGTGMGMALAANKIRGIRATLCHDTYSAEKSKSSNDANILTIGGLVIGFELAQKIVNVWLNTTFSGGNSQRKIEKIMNLESELKYER